MPLSLDNIELGLQALRFGMLNIISYLNIINGLVQFLGLHELIVCNMYFAVQTLVEMIHHAVSLLEGNRAIVTKENKKNNNKREYSRNSHLNYVLSPLLVTVVIHFI